MLRCPSTSGTSSAGFIKPVNSYITTGLYYSSGSFHGAVDYGASGINGMPIYAVADGIVVTTQALTTTYGNYIIIQHSDGNYTLYAHLHENTIKVKAGDSVEQGQVIAKMGSSGNSTGTHLHFEVREGQNASSAKVDPLDYVSRFDIGCLLSRWEGFGLVIPEYMMCGVPIVATNVDAIPYLINNGENGLLVEKDDWKGAAKKVVELAENEGLRKIIVENGQRTVITRFDARRVTKECEELYEVLME